MPQLPLTIKEARKILGKDADGLSDTQVQEILINLRMIARKSLLQISSKKV